MTQDIFLALSPAPARSLCLCLCFCLCLCRVLSVCVCVCARMFACVWRRSLQNLTDEFDAIYRTSVHADFSAPALSPSGSEASLPPLSVTQSPSLSQSQPQSQSQSQSQSQIAAKTMSVKLDLSTRARVENLAEARQRMAHWVMRETVTQYVDRE